MIKLAYRYHPFSHFFTTFFTLWNARKRERNAYKEAYDTYDQCLFWAPRREYQECHDESTALQCHLYQFPLPRVIIKPGAWQASSLWFSPQLKQRIWKRLRVCCSPFVRRLECGRWMRVQASGWIVIKDGLNVSASGPACLGDHSQNAGPCASLAHI